MKEIELSRGCIRVSVRQHHPDWDLDHLLDFAEIVSSDSVQKLIEVGRNNRMEQDKQNQAQKEHEQSLMDKQLQAQAQEKQADREWEEASKERDREVKLEAERINALGRASDKQSDVTGINAINKATQDAFDNDYKQADLSLKEKQVAIKEQESQAKLTREAEELKIRLQELALKREKLNTDRYVATINKN